MLRCAATDCRTVFHVSNADSECPMRFAARGTSLREGVYDRMVRGGIIDALERTVVKGEEITEGLIPPLKGGK